MGKLNRLLGIFLITGVIILSLIAMVNFFWPKRINECCPLNWDIGYSIVQTSDGGYLIAGMKSSRYPWIIKINKVGEVEWSKTFFITVPGSSFQKIVRADADSYVAVGSVYSDTWDIACIKVNENGDIEWNKTYSDDEISDAFSITQTRDGGYLIVGRIKSSSPEDYDLLLVKMDESGNMEWRRTYGGEGSDIGLDIIPALDEGYIIVGETNSYGPRCTWLIKINESGDVEWNKTYGYGIAHSIIQSYDEVSYIIVGWTKQLESEEKERLWVLKINRNGEAEWNKTYNYAIGYSITQTYDGGYIVLGATSFNETSTDVLLIKIDDHGNLVWNRTYGGRGDDRGFSIIQSSDGGYVIVGETSSFGADGFDVLLMKIDGDGNLEWIKTYSGNKSNFSAFLSSNLRSMAVMINVASSSGVTLFKYRSYRSYQ